MPLTSREVNILRRNFDNSVHQYSFEEDDEMRARAFKDIYAELSECDCSLHIDPVTEKGRLYYKVTITGPHNPDESFGMYEDFVEGFVRQSVDAFEYFEGRMYV